MVTNFFKKEKRIEQESEGKYWYIIAKVKGKPHVFGAYSSKDIAQQIVDRYLKNVVWEIISADTKDRNKITQEFRHDVFVETGEIERIKHQLEE